MRFAKRQMTWFRHQLDGDVLRLDATRPAISKKPVYAKGQSKDEAGRMVEAEVAFQDEPRGADEKPDRDDGG